MSGWIKLHRKLCDNEIWLKEPFSRGQAWVDLLLLASHKDTHFWKRGVLVEQKRGQVGVSLAGLALRWKWSRNKVKKFLKDLEKVQQIEQQNNNVTSLITLIKYDQYQEIKAAERAASETASETANDTAEGPADEHNQEVKKKEVKKKEVIKALGEKAARNSFSPPSLEEVSIYCDERKNDIDPEYWIDYHVARGWLVGKAKTPMKDWKATIRTWEKNGNNYGRKQGSGSNITLSAAGRQTAAAVQEWMDGSEGQA